MNECWKHSRKNNFICVCINISFGFQANIFQMYICDGSVLYYFSVNSYWGRPFWFDLKHECNDYIVCYHLIIYLSDCYFFCMCILVVCNATRKRIFRLFRFHLSMKSHSRFFLIHKTSWKHHTLIDSNYVHFVNETVIHGSCMNHNWKLVSKNTGLKQ